MAEMEQIIVDAKAFVQRARAVQLDSLLADADEVAKEFKIFEIQVQATKAYWISRNGWDTMSKPELVELATQRKCVFRSNESKSGLLAKVVHAHWTALDVSKAVDAADAEATRIRVWARRLGEVPENLQTLIRDGKSFYEEWKIRQSKSMAEAASHLRHSGLDLLDWDWAMRKAQAVLRDINNGMSLATAVKEMANDVQLAIVGIIPSNFSVSGTGLEHMASVGGAKMLTKAFYKAVPQEAYPFLATVYTR